MNTATIRRTRPGRVGSLRSVRKLLWQGLSQTRTILDNAEENATRLAACTVLVQGASVYVVINRAIEHPDA